MDRDEMPLGKKLFLGIVVTLLIVIVSTVVFNIISKNVDEKLTVSVTQDSDIEKIQAALQSLLNSVNLSYIEEETARKNYKVYLNTHSGDRTPKQTRISALERDMVHLKKITDDYIVNYNQVIKYLPDEAIGGFPIHIYRESDSLHYDYQEG